MKNIILKIKNFFNKDARTMPNGMTYVPFKVGSLINLNPNSSITGSLHKESKYSFNVDYKLLIAEDLFPTRHAYMCYVLDKNQTEEFCALTLHGYIHQVELIS